MNHIEGLLRRVVDEAAEGNPDCCILLESASDPNKWVQLTWANVNAAYPFPDEPLARLRAARVPEYPDYSLLCWESGKYATFDHPADPLDGIAAFVAGYFERVLGVSAAEEALRVEVEQL
jgi:hypothetical protein